MAGTNDTEGPDETEVSAQERERLQIDRIAARLEALVGQRDPGVKSAMAGDQSGELADRYRAKEQRWNTAADEVRDIIRLMHQSLGENDAVEKGTQGGSEQAGDGIG
ncbi:hypothetical protein [Myceligenerans indicum]|uniref:Uncharacterized protein n=1 Tax=Myceligenerans indicum TaxID=2593663 RepID=A0ABS1LJX7_9MICO|nr:hypothetical protein [Myceligenerans indicum]MBL0886143.1 hypothetical protein [Myceligenerans indicum]